MAVGTMGLTGAQRDRFAHDGFLVVHDALDLERDIAPVMAEYEQVLDAFAADLHAEGSLGSTHAELAFGDRLIEVWEETAINHAQHFDILPAQQGDPARYPDPHRSRGLRPPDEPSIARPDRGDRWP